MPIATASASAGDPPAHVELLLGGAEHLGVVLGGHLQAGHPGADLAGHVAEAAVHLRRDIQAARDVVVLDHGRGGSHLDGGYVGKADVIAGRRVDQQIADGRGGVPGRRRTPDHDVEDLLILVQAADRQARVIGRRCPPNIAGGDAVFLRRGEVDLHLDSRLRDHLLHRRTDHAGHVRDQRANLIGLGGQFGQIGPVHPDDQRSEVPVFAALTRSSV